MRKLLLLGFLVACSSTPSGNDGGTDATVDAPADTGTKDAATDSGGDAGAQVTLTLKNYLAWCDVSVNSGATSTSDQSLPFAKGAVVNLHSEPGNTFFWGYWVGTDKADGGEDLNKTTTVTMSADKTIQACCPDTDGGSCPAP